MTPETRAARDELATFLDACDRHPDGIDDLLDEITVGMPLDHPAVLRASSLRTVLAALDGYDESAKDRP